MSPMQPSFQDPSGGGGYGGGFGSQGQMNDFNSGLNREMQGFGGTEDPRLAAMKQRFQQQNPQQQPYNNMAAMNPMQKPGGL